MSEVQHLSGPLLYFNSAFSHRWFWRRVLIKCKRWLAMVARFPLELQSYSRACRPISRQCKIFQRRPRKREASMSLINILYTGANGVFNISNAILYHVAGPPCRNKIPEGSGITGSFACTPNSPSNATIIDTASAVAYSSSGLIVV